MQHYYLNGKVILYESELENCERLRIGREGETQGRIWQSLIMGEDLGDEKFENRFSHTDHVEIIYNPKTGRVDKVSLRKPSNPRSYQSFVRDLHSDGIDPESLERIFDGAKELFITVKSQLPTEYKSPPPLEDTIKQHLNSFSP